MVGPFTQGLARCKWSICVFLDIRERRVEGVGGLNPSPLQSPCVFTPSLCPFPRFSLLLPTPCSLLFQPCYIPVHIPVWEKWSSRWIQSHFTLKYKQLNRTHFCPSCNGLQSYCENYINQQVWCAYDITWCIVRIVCLLLCWWRRKIILVVVSSKKEEVRINCVFVLSWVTDLDNCFIGRLLRGNEQ